MNQTEKLERRLISVALVVEDEGLIRLMIRDVLEDLGLEVHEAADGEGGLAALLAYASIGLVITDIAMPGMDGLTMLARAREHRRDFIALTTSGHAEAPKDEVFLRKPYRAADLKAKLAQMLVS